MSSVAEAARALERISQLCRTTDDSRQLRVEVLREIAKVLDYQAYAWLLTDPVTSVGSAPLADIPRLQDLPTAIRLKYLTHVNRWTSLTEVPVARLRDATGGDLEQSLMWRELLREYDVVDVASVGFGDSYGCWAFLDLWRTHPASPFTARDAEFLVSVSETATGALRRGQARALMERPTPDRNRFGPVVLLLANNLEVVAQTPETQGVLRAILPTEVRRSPVPATAYNVGAQLLANEAGVDASPAMARLHLAHGQWVTFLADRIHGEPNAATRDGIAVTIEETAPNDRRELFARAFGLGPRENELLGHLCAGGDTKSLAALMFVSEHTVQDHLKSIFAKTATRSRQMLLARALGT